MDSKTALENAKIAARMTYEEVYSDASFLHGLMAWYFAEVGNRGMAVRLLQGDSIPTVELSSAHRMAKDALRTWTEASYDESR